MQPHVVNIAKMYLCIMATSVSSERAFSAAGRIHTKRRFGMLQLTMDDLLFIREHVPHVTKFNDFLADFQEYCSSCALEISDAVGAAVSE